MQVLMANPWTTQTCRPSSNSSAGSNLPYHSNSASVISPLVPTASTDGVKNLWGFSNGLTVQ